MCVCLHRIELKRKKVISREKKRKKKVCAKSRGEEGEEGNSLKRKLVQKWVTQKEGGVEVLSLNFFMNELEHAKDEEDGRKKR